MSNTYTVTVTYVGEVVAKCADDIEQALWETCEIVGPPFNILLNVERADIVCEDDEE